VTRVYFSIGSNIDPLQNVELGVREIARRFGPADISPIYRNKAVGFASEDFLNLVVGVDTDLSVEEICREIDAIHVLAQRPKRDQKLVARTLDIDLLLYGQRISNGPPLRLPRVDVLKYAFALKPLADIAPDECHPETGESYAQHWAAMDQTSHPLTRVENSLTNRDCGRRQSR